MKNKYVKYYLIFIPLFIHSQIKKDSSAYKNIDSVFIRKNSHNAQKITYSFNKERLIKNIRTQEIITAVPYVTLGNDKSLFYKGNKIEQISINGIKSSLTELNSVQAQDIQSVEVIYSNLDLTTGENKLTINIKTKFNPGIKGYLDVSPGVLQDFFYEGAGLSIKNKNTYISFLHSNLWNHNSGSVDQQYINSNNYLKTTRNLYQPYNSISINHIINNQSINAKFFYSGIKENSYSILNNDSKSTNQMNMKLYNINFLYDLTFGKYTFKLNSDFIVNNNTYNNTNYTKNSSDQNFKEFAVSPFLSRKLKKGNIGLGLIYTNRNLDSHNFINESELANSINQYIYNFVVLGNYNITPKLSFSASLKYQKYEDKFNKKDIILPYVKILKNFEKIGDIELVYKRNISRPNIYSLSGSMYQEIDGSITYTNPYLKFQISDLFDLSLSPKLKKGNISFGVSYEKLQNQISTEKKMVDNMIHNNVVNVLGRETGFNLSFSYPISENFDVNSFYKYFFLTNEFENSIIKGNYSIYGLSLNGKILKEYNISLNSNYRNKIYDANYFIKLKPEISFTVSRNLFNNLIYASLEFRNILDNDSKREFMILDNNNNSFKNISYLNSRLFLFTFSYNFGKSFEMKKKNINNINSDILPK